MGASQEVNADDGNELYGLYRKACKGVGFEGALCSHYGLPFIPWKDYKEKWTDVWTLWKSRICDRLTTPKQEMVFVPPSSNYRYSYNPEGDTLQVFWEQFGTASGKHIVNLDSKEKFSALIHRPSLSALMNRLVLNAGIVMDLTLPNQEELILGPNYPLIEQMHMLGFNLIQLRLANNYDIGYTPKALPSAVPSDRHNARANRHVRPSITQIKVSLVKAATQMVSLQCTHYLF